jgi:NTE family protein
LMMLPGAGAPSGPGSGARRARRTPAPPDDRLKVFETRLRREDGSLVECRCATSRSLRSTQTAARSASSTAPATSTCCTPWPRAARSRSSGPPSRSAAATTVDGGMRSAANADLATGCDVVLAVVPLWRALSRHPRGPEQLRRTGARRTAWINPDKESLTAIGGTSSTRRTDGCRPGRARPGSPDGGRGRRGVA